MARDELQADELRPDKLGPNAGECRVASAHGAWAVLLEAEAGLRIDAALGHVDA